MNLNRIFPSLVIILFCLLGRNLSAQEGSLYKIDLKEKIDSSSLIVSGKVIKCYSYMDISAGMIYTNNTIQVFSIYKGSLAFDTISIKTVGGRVGNEMVTTSSLLTLDSGDVGVFFCKTISGSSQYDVYASKQGFLKATSGIVSCPFYSSSFKNLEAELVTLTQLNQSQNPIEWQDTPDPLQLVTSLNFSPSIITSGTGSVLTITGSGFGTIGPDAQNYVAFANANNGGAPSYIIPPTLNYISWSNNQIEIIVPTEAGTGPISVTVAGVHTYSANELTIPYAILNSGDGYIPHLTNSNGSGGITWTFNSNMNFANGAAAPFNRARNTWKCATGVNWNVASFSTSIDDPIMSDGVNVVAQNSVAQGVLGVCYSYTSSCNGVDWHVTGQDIIFKDYWLGNGSWNYSTSAPSSGEYDFESVALHELGHAHVLGHVIENNDVMNWNIANGQMERILTSENIAAGNLVMDLSTVTNGCSVNPMTQVFPGGCSESIETGLWMVESNHPLDNATCFGLHNIEVSFGNYGFAPITHIDFNWSVNGVWQSPVVWNGNLLFNQVIQDLQIGSYSFQDSVYEVAIWASNVNGLQESNQTNDTIVYSFHAIPCTPNNVGLGAIGTINVNSCLTTENITVDFFNAGTNVVNTSRIYFEANGILTDSLDWIGSLNPGDTIHDLLVTTYSDFYPSTNLRLWIGLTNGLTDTYFNNDTATVFLVPLGLSGTYTVGGINPDFATPNAVFAHLDTYGICGDVTFNIRNGVYPTSFMIDSIPNNSSHTIIMQSESGNPDDVTILKSSTSATFEWQRIHNFTLNKLSFNANNDPLGWKIYVQFGASHLTFSNNSFIGTSINIEPNVFDHHVDTIQIVNNRFNGGNIYSHDWQSFNTVSSSIIVRGNLFEQLGGYINIEGYKDVTISHNHVWTNNIGYHDGITVSYNGDSLNIFNNVVEKHSAGGSALAVKRSNPISDSTVVRVYNNQLLLSVNNGIISWGGAAEFWSLPKIEFINNSVLYEYDTGSANSIHVVNLSSVDSAIIQNNQLVNYGQGVIYGIGNQSLGYLKSDYNNYWTTSNFANYYNGGYIANLAAFSSSTGGDTHSHFIEPHFIAPNYLYPLNTGALDNFGTPISYIQSDLNNVTRSNITPDIGAYEFHTLDYNITMLDYFNLDDTSFCSGTTSNLLFKAFNSGTQTITSFYAYINIDGIAYDTLLINQTILPQQSAIFQVGNYTFTNPITQIDVSCGLPNNMIDSIASDNNYATTFHTKLNGIYTVGGVTADFESIQLALESLGYGLCGPVVFNLKDGYHDNWGTIGLIPNNNNNNTITFQAESLDTGSVIISANSSSSILSLNGPQYIQFKHLKFAPHDAFTYAGIELKNVIELEFDSCKFINSGINHATNFPVYTNLFSLKHSHLISSGISLRDDAYNFTLTDNLIEGSSRIFLIGNNTIVPHPTTILISRNQFNSLSNSVINNAIINLKACENFEISKNSFNTSRVPFSIISADAGYALIKNNFVRSTTYAGEFENNSVLKIVNNSFRTGTFYLINANPSIEFKNNIVYSSSPNMFCFNSNQYSGLISDYNLFYGYSNTNFIYNYSSITYISYLNWHNTYGKDLHSITGEPNFMSVSDLHINSILADSNGTSLPFVTDDIDNETRNITHPDIGADEFEFDLSTIFDIAVDSVVEPSNSWCFVGDSIKIILRNNYSQDLTSAQFQWSLNGGTAVTYNWTGLISPGQSMQITIGVATFVSGDNYSILITATNPNGQTDWFPINNTLQFNYIAYSDATINASQNVICGAEDITLSSSTSTLNSIYLWSTGETQNSIQTNTPGTYWLHVINQYGCASSDTMSFNAYPAPIPVTIVASDTIICTGESVELFANPIINGNSYTWNWTALDTTNITVDNGTLITLTTTDTNGCTTSDQQQINEFGIPNASFSMNGSFVLTNTGTTDVTYQWLLNGLPIPGATSSTYAVHEDGDYSLVSTYISGCSDTSSVLTVDYSGVGLEIVSATEIAVYPNPVSDYFVLEFKGEQTVDLVLLDMAGRIVKEMNNVTSQQQISISRLQAGTYNLQINGDKINNILLVKL